MRDKVLHPLQHTSLTNLAIQPPVWIWANPDRATLERLASLVVMLRTAADWERYADQVDEFISLLWHEGPTGPNWPKIRARKMLAIMPPELKGILLRQTLDQMITYGCLSRGIQTGDTIWPAPVRR